MRKSRSGELFPFDSEIERTFNRRLRAQRSKSVTPIAMAYAQNQDNPNPPIFDNNLIMPAVIMMMIGL